MRSLAHPARLRAADPRCPSALRSPLEADGPHGPDRDTERRGRAVSRRAPRHREAFRGSSELVRGRWWHPTRAVVFLSLITAVAGPLLTFALIFTPLPLFWTNVIGALIFALVIPYVALGYKLLYFDLQERAQTEPAKPR